MTISEKSALWKSSKQLIKSNFGGINRNLNRGTSPPRRTETSSLLNLQIQQSNSIITPTTTTTYLPGGLLQRTTTTPITSTSEHSNNQQTNNNILDTFDDNHAAIVNGHVRSLSATSSTILIPSGCGGGSGGGGGIGSKSNCNGNIGGSSNGNGSSNGSNNSNSSNNNTSSNTNIIARCCFSFPLLKAINVRRCVLALFAVTLVTIFYYTQYVESGMFVG